MHTFFAYAILALVGFATATVSAESLAGLSEAGIGYQRQSLENFAPVPMVSAVFAMLLFWNPVVLARRILPYLPFGAVVGLSAAALAYPFAYPGAEPYAFLIVPAVALIVALAAPVSAGRATPVAFRLLPKRIQAGFVAFGALVSAAIGFVERMRERMERVNAEQAALVYTAA